MAISSPELVSCSARIEEAIAIRAGDEAFIFAIKNHCGSPRRELEVFTVAGVQAAASGPLAFNVVPVRIEILDQVFRFTSAVVLTSDADITAGDNPVIRFYWNQIAGRQTGNNPIIQIDYDTVTNEAITTTSTLSFEGIDPFIMDARTLEHPDRLYMMYITESGQQALRVSEDLGVTWSAGCAFDANVRYVEGFIRDPNGLKESLRAMTMQSTQTVIDPQGDAHINDFSTTPVATGLNLIQRVYPFVRARRPKRINPNTNLDEQRFRRVRPLVIRTPPTTTEDPC